MGAALLFLPSAGGCAAGRAPDSLPARPYALTRLGPERTTIPYADANAEPKRIAFERINRDRALYGVRPVQYDTRAALVGDAFCLDQALGAATGHWDARGRAPYVRWGLAGGVDFHVQNAGALSNPEGRLDRPVAAMLLELHETMMNEKAPDDGHRRTILDPSLTHVGLGTARVGGEFRMSQEFTRVSFDWIEVPDRPLSAGSVASFAGRPRPGWVVGRIDIRFEPPLRPLALIDSRRARSYDYPPLIDTLRPHFPGRGTRAGEDDFDLLADGGVRARFRLSGGAGYYFVVCQLGRRFERSDSLEAATAAMVTAQ